ncbi:cell division septum initiation protein DivIVA [Nakamurella sp. UYEF19]|uniref:hypothetical protein n=1 Tax=Nakamurella sp. UYEF19 TaxID=1756392 RepID=UPI003392F689
MTSGDWLPAQAPFDLVRRGYSPEQVTSHLERLEYDLRITTANRDATNQRLTELGAQLAAAQAEADTLRSQLDRSALEPVSMANLSDRMQRMIRLAEEEASEIRARAETDADRLRGQLETSLGEAAQARAAFDAERERTRKQLAEQVHGLIAEATAEAEDTRNQAQEEASRLLQDANAEAERTVTQAREQAEQELAEARAMAEQEKAEAHRVAQQELAEARANAENTTNLANAASATLTSETAAERDRLDAASLAHRTQVEDDFEIAITARRYEANRVITDREEATAATAAKLVADATAHAEHLVATATDESETLMRQATTYSNALVNRASAESHQRVADADEAVQTLQTLRNQLADQLNSLGGHLDHIRELAGSAPAIITPPETEAGRPVSADFPADPTARPTPVDLPVPVLGEQDHPESANGAEIDGAAELNGSADVNGSTDLNGSTELNGAAGPAVEDHTVNGDKTDVAIQSDEAPPTEITDHDTDAVDDEVTQTVAVESTNGQRTRIRGGRGR